MIAYQEQPFRAHDAYVQHHEMRRREESEYAYKQQQHQQHGYDGLASSAGILPPPHPFAGRNSGYSSSQLPSYGQPGYYAPSAQVHQPAVHTPLNSAHPFHQNHDTLKNAGFAFIPAPGQYPSATLGQSQFVSAAYTRHDAYQSSVQDRQYRMPNVDETRDYTGNFVLPPSRAYLQSAFEQNNTGWQSTVAIQQSHLRQYQQAGYQEHANNDWKAFSGEEAPYGEMPGNQMDVLHTQLNEYEPFAGPTLDGQQFMQSNTREKARTAQVETAAPIEAVDLIAPDASAIAPPPPIAKSAHPLAALATDLVWEAFLNAANNNSPASLSPSQFTSSDRSGRSRFDDGSPISRRAPRASVSPSITSHQRTPSKTISPYVKKHDRSRSGSAGVEGEGQLSNGFGAIGGERKPRVSLDSSPGSDSTGPASSAPGTPAMDTWMLSAPGNGHGISRLGGSGYWSDEDNVGNVRQIGKQTLPPLSSLLRPAALQQQQRFGGVTPPLALFEQIQKLLAATLLSQQVLLLALYYVSKIPYTSPLYPPATSQSALQSTSAPFKLLLAALVVANKHLDDNSFRNSTFAQVANIAVPEVNALEYSLLGDLHFDINVEAPVWMAWLRELQGHQATRFTRDQVSSKLILLDIIKGVDVQAEELELCRQQGRHAISLGPDTLLDYFHHRGGTARPIEFLPSTPRSESSMSGCFDLDAAGPIEQRPRYGKQIVLPQVPEHYGLELPAFSGAFELPSRMAMA